MTIDLKLTIENMKRVEVVAAVIVNDGKYLCVQRGENKLNYISRKWEFPGGKIEEGETREVTIIREIKEELNMEVNPIKDLLTVEHQYPDFHLTMHSFICEAKNIDLVLTEHIDYKWLDISDMDQLDWAAADIPIVNELKLI